MLARASSCVGSSWCHAMFKIKYCHKIFDDKEVRVYVAELFFLISTLYDMPIKKMGFGDDHVHLQVNIKLKSKTDAAKILKGKQVKIDTYIVPATTEIARRLKTDLVDGVSIEQIFLNAGARIGEASCAACLGGPKDTFGRLNGSEVCISTTNRNFPGRMGSKKSQVYLASPYTVAASAITGKITDPRKFLG